MNQFTPYSPAEDAAIREFAADGLTSRQIAIALAEVFGVTRTRNSVIGRLTRLQITLGGNSPEARKVRGRLADEKRAKVEPKPAPMHVLRRIEARTAQKLEVEPEPEPFVEREVIQLREYPSKHFLEVGFGDCRMPLWKSTTAFEDKRFCAAPVVPGQSYCARCSKVVFRESIHPSMRLPGDKQKTRAA